MILLLCTFFLFAAGITANKMALASLSPIMLTSIRMLVGGSILILYHYLTTGRTNLGRLKSDWRLIATIALFTILLPACLKSYGLKYLYSFKAALIGACDPFVTALYSYVLWKERLTIQKVIGLLVAFGGGIVLFLTTSPLELTTPGLWHVSLPEISAFLAMVIARYGWIQVQKVVRAEHYSPVSLISLMMILSGLGALSITLTFETHSLENIFVNWKALLVTTLIGNVLGYTFFTHQLKKHSSMVVSVVGYSVPVFVFINGIIFLAEPIQVMSIVAGLIIFSGMLIFYSSSFFESRS